MSQLVWAGASSSSHAKSLNSGVIYYKDSSYEVWSGLQKVELSLDGDSEIAFYNGDPRAISAGHVFLGLGVDCFIFPPSILEKQVSGFLYRTTENGTSKYIVVYNPVFSLSEREFGTDADTIEPYVFNLIAGCVAEDITDMVSTSLVKIDLDAEDLLGSRAGILRALFGTDTTSPHLPTAQQLVLATTNPSYFS